MLIFTILVKKFHTIHNLFKHTQYLNFWDSGFLNVFFQASPCAILEKTVYPICFIIAIPIISHNVGILKLANIFHYYQLSFDFFIISYILFMQKFHCYDLIQTFIIAFIDITRTPRSYFLEFINEKILA